MSEQGDTSCIITVAPLVCSISPSGAARFLRSALVTEREYFRPVFENGYKRKKRFTYPIHYVLKGRFPTGLLEIVTSLLKSKGFSIQIIDRRSTIKSSLQSSFGDITLRDFQFEAVTAAVSTHGGYIQSPTGSGKTVIAAGIINALPSSNVLFIVPTKSLLTQTASSFEKIFGRPIGMIGAGGSTFQQITVGIINSIYNCYELGGLPRFDTIIVDECHRISKLDGRYAKFLLNYPSLRRYGISATPHKKNLESEEYMVMSACLGRELFSADNKQLIEDHFIAKPTIKIIRAPFYQKANEQRAWPDVYEYGVVANPNAIRAIADSAISYVQSGKSILIMCQRIRHLLNIEHTLLRLKPDLRTAVALGGPNKEITTELDGLARWLRSAKATGNGDLSRRLTVVIEKLTATRQRLVTASKSTERIRQELDRKELDIVIATTVWKEGTDIPSLDVVINAAGYKSDILVQQIMGRGMRATSEKDSFILVDIFDPSHHYLIKHFGERICLYFDKKWM